MAKRTKKIVLTGITREQMEQAFGEFALADARIQRIGADLDAKITKLREEKALELAALEQAREDAFEVMQAFAAENREALFSKKKSMDTAHGVLGFRIGNPKLKLLKGYTWLSVLSLARERMPDFIRTSEEVNKDKLLDERKVDGMEARMAKIGVTVVQDETFYVEPKKEEV